MVGRAAPAAAGATSAGADSASAAPAPTATVTPAAAAPAGSSTTMPATSAAATPCPSATAPTATSPAPTATTPGPTATTPTSAPTAPAPDANADCEIIVPAHPLSARGLATPYQLTGPDGATPAASGCTMANAANLGAFVQATILDQATGKLWVYEPLVITKGTRPAAAPVTPRLPKHAVVTIDFGFKRAKQRSFRSVRSESVPAPGRSPCQDWPGGSGRGLA